MSLKEHFSFHVREAQRHRRTPEQQRLDEVKARVARVSEDMDRAFDSIDIIVQQVADARLQMSKIKSALEQGVSA